MLNFRMAECYMALNQGGCTCLLRKSKKCKRGNDKDLEYNMALAYRMLADQDKAIGHLKTYLSNEKLSKFDRDKAEELKKSVNSR